MKAIYNLFFLLPVVSFFVTACNNHDLPEDKGEPTVISLSMSNTQTRGGNLFSGENLITKIRIYVFNGNYVDNMEVFNSGDAEFQNPFRIQTTTGAKTVYVIANEPDDMSTSLNAITTLNALKALVTSAISAPMVAPFTMTGFQSVNVTHVPSPGAPTQITVNLTRLVAKLTLTIRKGNLAQTNNIPIVLKEVQLHRASAKSALFENQPVSSQTYWSHSYVAGTGIPLTTTGTNVWTSSLPMYIYENVGSVNDTTGRASYLVIDALYNNINTRYRAYINDTNSDATDHKYSVKRNHQYNLTAIINDIGEYDGLLLQCRAIPWDLVESSQSFEDDEPAVVIEPGFTDVNANVTSTTDKLTFTFTLITGPEGATWRASLDNGLEFGFEDVEQTHGGIGETKTITIKPLKPYNPTITRTTHFYITVTNPANGETQRIKLVPGQPDTQILITQQG